MDEADRDTMTASKETMEDYTLRFAPRSYRKWSTGVVGISALGGIAYLADFAIGANVRHAKFGEGVVINFEGRGLDARIQVRFRTEGTKWLALQYAKLTPA